jgi:hypothetical protein
MESIFLQIARDAVEGAERNELEIEKAGSYSAELQMQRQAIVAIVILVQALEAFINVQASKRLSSAITESVDRLSVVSKWLVVTKTVTGTEWDKGQPPFQDFQSLVKTRNDLVHYKPKFTEVTHPDIDAYFHTEFTGTLARRYFDATCEMIKGFYSKAGEQVPDDVKPTTRTVAEQVDVLL